MSDNVVDINSKRDDLRHKRKEKQLNELKSKFEKALPTEEQDPKQKLLSLFKKKPKQ
ncbi:MULTISPECIES: hypothetical protein [Amphritea]|uniref:Uncharacterized protein n=2 Tax=Amphritea TaxID=515417 RepID=A0A1H9IPB6_9GAMM|nr:MULTISPECIES: hypothetical protein [Amphritea]MBN0988675.1 hypothetical protein [Amphritea pacifica]MBN1005421.1 hypothetical protein [Amphritea pacifica]SEQ76225.1 hypothetical protein SAMN03080615_02674 [Amphritea atlantica]